MDAFQAMNEIAETDPASLQAKIKDGTLEYRVPFMINNVHTDECPGVDGQLSFLYALATQDSIDYRTLTGFLDESVDIHELFAEDVVDLGITGLGSQKFTADENGRIRNNTGRQRRQRTIHHRRQVPGCGRGPGQHYLYRPAHRES